MIVAAYRALSQMDAVLSEDREIRMLQAQAAAQARNMSKQARKSF